MYITVSAGFQPGGWNGFHETTRLCSSGGTGGLIHFSPGDGDSGKVSRLFITIAGMEYFVGGPVLLVLAGHWVDWVERLVRQLEGLAKFVALVAEKIWVNIDVKRKPS